MNIHPLIRHLVVGALLLAFALQTASIGIWLWARYKEPNIIVTPTILVPMNACKDADYWDYPQH